MTRGGSFAVRPAPEEGAGVLPNGTKGKERIFIELRVYAKYFFYLYTIEDFTELTIDRYNLGASQLRLSVDRRSPSACFLQLGNWLQRAGVHEFYAIQQLEVYNDIVTVTACSPHFFAGKYLIKPDGSGQKSLSLEEGSSKEEGSSNEERKVTGSYDQAVKDWFNSSGINMTTAPARPSGEGGDVTLSADCYSNLAAAMEEVLAPRLMGVRYTFNEQLGGFVFDTVEPVDRTSQNGAPSQSAAGTAPAIFSVQYDNLRSLRYSADDLERVTNVYARSGSGSSSSSVTQYGEDTYGYDRREAYINLSDEDIVQQRVDDAMKKTDISFTAQIYEDENLVYGVDYDIGDIVTAWLELPSLQYVEDSQGRRFYDPVLTWQKVDQQITCITEHYSNSAAGAGRELDITFGKPEKTLPEQLKVAEKKQKQQNDELWKKLRKYETPLG